MADDSLMPQGEYGWRLSMADCRQTSRDIKNPESFALLKIELWL
jgi:hypothetical protein